jgi:hypothetical protein
VNTDSLRNTAMAPASQRHNKWNTDLAADSI